MFIFKLLFLVSCVYTTCGSESSEELEALLSSSLGVELLRVAIKQSYDEDKLEIISNAVQVQQEMDLNITLVGSQNIYGPNGDLVEIRTVELNVPQIVKGSATVSDEDDDDDDDDDDDMSQLRKLFDFITKLGFSMDVTNEEYNKNGDITEKAYIDNNILYEFSEGIYSINKTIEVNSSKIVEAEIKKLQEQGSPVGVHKFNAQGQFLSEGSTIIPEYIVTVVGEDDEVDQELLEGAQRGFATVFLKYQNNQEEVPNKLAEYLSLEFPKLDFNVFLTEPTGWYVSKGYKINLQFDLTDWDSTEKIVYSIFVQKKVESPTSTPSVAS